MITGLIVMSIIFTSCLQKEDIKIGLAIGLTGRNADGSYAVRNTVILLTKRINEQGGIDGHMIDLIIKDDQSDLEMVRKVDREFIEKGVKFVIGHDTSMKAQTTLQAIDGEDILYISPTIATSEVSGIDDNFFRIRPTDVYLGESAVKYMEKKNYDNVLIIYDSRNRAGAEGAITSIKSGVKGACFEHALYEKGELGLEKTLDILDKENIQTVIIMANSGDFTRIAQYLRSKNYNQPFLISNWSNANDLYERTGPAMDSTILLSTSNLYPDTEAYHQFYNDYLNEYGFEPITVELLTYDAFNILVKAMEKDPTDVLSVKNQLLSIKNYQGLTGNFSFDDYGDVLRESMFYIMKDGKWKLVE